MEEAEKKFTPDQIKEKMEECKKEPHIKGADGDCRDCEAEELCVRDISADSLMWMRQHRDPAKEEEEFKKYLRKREKMIADMIKNIKPPVGMRWVICKHCGTPAGFTPENPEKAKFDKVAFKVIPKGETTEVQEVLYDADQFLKYKPKCPYCSEELDLGHNGPSPKEKLEEINKAAKACGLKEMKPTNLIEEED